MDTLSQIVHEIVFGSRATKIKLIKELAGDEFDTIESLWELAEQTDEQMNIQLSSIFEYYIRETSCD